MLGSQGEFPGHLDQGDLICERSIGIGVGVDLPDGGSYPWEPFYHGLHGIEPLGEHLFQVIDHGRLRLLGKNTPVSFLPASRQDPNPRVPDKGTLQFPSRRKPEFGPWNREPFQKNGKLSIRRTFHISEYGRV